MCVGLSVFTYYFPKGRNVRTNRSKLINTCLISGVDKLEPVTLLSVCLKCFLIQLNFFFF